MLEAAKHRISSDSLVSVVAGVMVGEHCMVDSFLGGEAPASLRPAGTVVD